jgi:hypothetical protein
VAASSVLTAHASTVAEKRRQRGPKTAHGSRQEGDRTPLRPNADMRACLAANRA